MHNLPSHPLYNVRETLIGFPRPDQLGRTLLKQWLAKYAVPVSVDEIDVVTFHYQYVPLSAGQPALTAHAVLTQNYTLVEALLNNWQGEPAQGYLGFHAGDWAGIAPQGALTLVERLQPAGIEYNSTGYLIFNGLYRRTAPARYDASTRLPLRAEDLQAFIWAQDFNHAYKASLDLYWKRHLAHYQQALKITFIAAVNHQVSEGSLSERGRILAWQVAGLMPTCNAGERSNSQVAVLNVYGYSATSLLCLQDIGTGLTLLYIPGNSSPLHEFADASEMKHWFARQCRDPDRREALKHCFSPADLPDGLDFSGLETALAGLGLYPHPHRFAPSHVGFATSGVWEPDSVINYRTERYSPQIAGDLFLALAYRQQARAYADADSLITRNADVTKARLTSYLQAALTLLAPAALMLPELAPVFAIGGVLQFALGLDSVLHGKSLDEKVAGVQSQAYGLLNALPLVPAAVHRLPKLFSYRRPGFIPVQRLPRFASDAPLQPQAELSCAEAAFRPVEFVSPPPSAVPLPVARWVDADLQPRFSALFGQGEQRYFDSVCYELQTDSFIKVSDLHLDAPPRYRPSSDGECLVPLDPPQRDVTAAQRTATLRQLGIELQLPLDDACYASLQPAPLPRRISSVWVGTRAIDPPYLAALAHNARVLQGSDFHYELFLSSQLPERYEANLALLNAHAPGLRVSPLEKQPFFQDFKASPYYAQYQAAIDGNGGVATNFSSASDILRYRLLKHLGGFYMDADDRLLEPAVPGPSTPALTRAVLQTTPDGLLLASPVSNDELGMYMQYNTSFIGSHAGNPTLDAISDEIARRFEADPTFYDYRPDPLHEPASFHEYKRRLNQLTGPGVLNAVITQRLPWLAQLRETCNLWISPVRDRRLFINAESFFEHLDTFTPWVMSPRSAMFTVGGSPEAAGRTCDTRILK